MADSTAEPYYYDGPMRGRPYHPTGARRLQRLDRLAWVLDRSIPIGRCRIGLDPIIGLLPGAGDWIGAMLSLYVLYEGARLGVPRSVLTRMTGNILLETVVGAVPVVGDLFDFAWKANTRNMALIQQHYDPSLKPRPLRRVGWTVLIVAIVVLGVIAVAGFFLISALVGLVKRGIPVG